MLTQNPVMTNLAVSDLKKALQFYQDTLGLKVVEKNEEQAVILQAGKGTHLQIYQKDAVNPSQNTCASFEVPDVQSAMSQLDRHGVHFEEYDMPGVQTHGAVATVGTHKAAWFKDPDGNILCLHQGPK